MAVLVHCVVGHVHVALSNGLTFDTAEVDRFFLWVVLHDLDDREPINSEEVSISTFSNGTGSRRTIVQVHTHARFLGTLASEDVDGA
jgi:hypothetical protein